MSNITQLKDKDGNNIYPISSDKLILDENGKSIREKVDEHLSNHPQGFSGDYNDLTNKPNIPTTEGLATEVYVDERFADIVNSAPEALDTLKELSDALGNDPNFATTVAAQIGTKADSSHVNSELSKKANVVHRHNVDEIDGLDLGEDVDLSNYYTKIEVDNKDVALDNKISDLRESKADKTDIHTHSNMDAINSLNSEHIEKISKALIYNGIVSNANNATNLGVYKCQNNCSNIPVAEYSIIQVAKEIGYNTLIQTWYSVTSNKIRMRRQANGTWGSWYKVYTEQEKPSATEIGASLVDHVHDDIHSHNNKSILDSITSGKVSEWDNKSDFNGDYNSLINTPNIPIVDVTKDYVDAELLKKSDIHEHPYKSVEYVPAWSEILNVPSEFNPTEHEHSLYIQYDSSEVLSDANTFNITGYRKTNRYTENLPNGRCTSGVLQNTFEWEGRTGIQLFYVCSDTNVSPSPARGEIWTREMNSGTWGSWHKISVFDGDYASLSNIPNEFNPTSHAHNKSDISDFEHTHSDYIPFSQSYTSDANTHTVNGAIKTNTGTQNLPANRKTWGVLFNMMENVGGVTGTQTFYVTAGTYKGEVWTRGVENRGWGTWYKFSTFDGNYSSLANIPSSFNPSTHTHTKTEVSDFEHRHDASEIDNLPSGGDVDLTDYYTKSETSGLLSNKADKVDTYTKTEVDDKIANLPSGGESIDFGANNTWTGTNTYTNLVVNEKNGEVQKMMPSSSGSACYYSFYKNRTNRSGYFGYESSSNNHFVIANESSNADVNIKTNGTGKVKYNGSEVAKKTDLDAKANTEHTHDDKLNKSVYDSAIGNYKLWAGTQSEYDAIATKDSNTLYFIKEA